MITIILIYLLINFIILVWFMNKLYEPRSKEIEDRLHYVNPKFIKKMAFVIFTVIGLPLFIYCWIAVTIEEDE